MSEYHHSRCAGGRSCNCGTPVGLGLAGRREGISSFRRCVLMCLALLAGTSGLAQGSAITSWTGSVSDLWTQGANWDNGVPALGYVAQIGNVANNPVSLTGSAIIDGLTTGALNSLTLQSGATLTLQGTGPFLNAGTVAVASNSVLRLTGGSAYTNDGQITLNGSSNYSLLVLTGSGTVNLDGTGTLSMTNSAYNHIDADTAGLTLVNGAGHSITGAGVLGGFQPFTLRNEGTITGQGSAGLEFWPTVTVENTGGTIRADGTKVTFTYGNPLAGGTLDLIHGGTMELPALVSDAAVHIDGDSSLTLRGTTLAGSTVSNSGTIVVPDNAMARLSGGTTVHDNGQITLNGSSNYSLLVLTGSGTVNLDGTGTLSMTNSAYNHID
ncbi:MAG: hypothetical protein M1376_08620, partial [Planctomycetes bacterium]|nr:hypothetical protein [Planctomycetota bacterium]